MSTKPNPSHEPGRLSRHDPEHPLGAWRSGPSLPVVGITSDLGEAPGLNGGPPRPRAVCAMTYIRAVAEAGGVPMVLPPIPELAHQYVRRCDAFVFTGGDDPRTEPFGHPTHPKATPVAPQRQAFEIALLDELRRRPAAPVLGVCLGMQMMALHAGGTLNQYMPDDTPTVELHRHDAVHPITIVPADAKAHGVLVAGQVTSHHRQAVRDAGSLRVVAVAPDGVIEAIDDPARAFYLGVQWHPERTAFEPLGNRLFRCLVEAARR